MMDSWFVLYAAQKKMYTELNVEQLDTLYEELKEQVEKCLKRFGMLPVHLIYGLKGRLHPKMTSIKIKVEMADGKKIEKTYPIAYDPNEATSTYKHAD